MTAAPELGNWAVRVRSGVSAQSSADRVVPSRSGVLKSFSTIVGTENTGLVFFWLALRTLAVGFLYEHE